jgi:alcohol dehydrogenase (cytochrome c)
MEDAMKRLVLTIAVCAALPMLLPNAQAAQKKPPASARTANIARQGSGGSQDPLQMETDPAQWVMPGKNYYGQRFSKLDQINTGNVKNMTVAWTFSTGVLRGHEAAPIVVGDTMYVITPWPNIVYALDLNNDGAIKWVFKPHPEAASQGVACCDVVNRGVA